MEDERRTGSSHPPDNSRKRAALACNYCRKRKRKCNGEKPVCSLCLEAGVECAYRELENVSRQGDLADTSFEQRLQRLESLVEATSQSSVALSQPSVASNFGIQNVLSPPLIQTTQLNHQNSLSPDGVFHATPSTGRLDESVSYNVEQALTIPIGHSTTTGNLLQMPPVVSLLGNFQKDIFLRTESKRQIPFAISLEPCSFSLLELPQLDMHTAQDLVDSYFTHVNPQHPILDRIEFNDFLHVVLDGGMECNADAALCLVVIALGQVAREQPSDHAPLWQPGVEYISPVLKILIGLWPSSFNGNIRIAQALYLTALYYSYLVRPLPAWRMVHMASTTLQHLLIQIQDHGNHSQDYSNQQPAIRACWAVFVLECDIIAEYHLPRSGIEHIIDSLPFPIRGDSSNKDMMYWLADLSARRLLNRVHHVMYDSSIQSTRRSATANATGQFPRSIASVLQISTELNHQLSSWYDLLPQSIKPDLENYDNHAWTLDEVIILQRFHAAGEIIFRPFFYHVCALPADTVVPLFMTENCSMCIHHCRQFLSLVDRRLEIPSASTEIVLHSTLAVTIILTLASISPLLKHLVPDIEELERNAAGFFHKWAFPGSSVESMLAIATTMSMKRTLVGDD